MAVNFWDRKMSIQSKPQSCYHNKLYFYFVDWYGSNYSGPSYIFYVTCYVLSQSTDAHVFCLFYHTGKINNAYIYFAYFATGVTK